MANRDIWTAGLGQGLSWGSAFGTEINSLASGYSVLSSVVVANGTALDLYADVSFSLTGTTPSSGVPFFALYVMALNQDGSTYGDGTQTTTGSATNPTMNSDSEAKVALGKSSAALVGMFRQIILPPGSFCFALLNGTGNALSSSGNTIKYRTYTINNNG